MHDKSKVKIYSRPRIHLPKIKLNKKGNGSIKQKNKEKIVKIFIILVIAISTVKLILDSVRPIFDELCADRAKSIATIVSNEQSTEVMKDHTYDESNIVKINEIISDVPNRIQQEIDKRGKENVEIALGSLTGIRILSGIGPRNKNSCFINRKC